MPGTEQDKAAHTVSSMDDSDKAPLTGPFRKKRRMNKTTRNQSASWLGKDPKDRNSEATSLPEPLRWIRSSFQKASSALKGAKSPTQMAAVCCLTSNQDSSSYIKGLPRKDGNKSWSYHGDQEAALRRPTNDKTDRSTLLQIVNEEKEKEKEKGAVWNATFPGTSCDLLKDRSLLDFNNEITLASSTQMRNASIFDDDNDSVITTNNQDILSSTISQENETAGDTERKILRSEPCGSFMDELQESQLIEQPTGLNKSHRAANRIRNFLKNPEHDDVVEKTKSSMRAERKNKRDQKRNQMRNMSPEREAMNYTSPEENAATPRDNIPLITITNTEGSTMIKPQSPNPEANPPQAASTPTNQCR